MSDDKQFARDVTALISYVNAANDTRNVEWIHSAYTVVEIKAQLPTPIGQALLEELQRRETALLQQPLSPFGKLKLAMTRSSIRKYNTASSILSSSSASDKE